jgi:hypothetical protein
MDSTAEESFARGNGTVSKSMMNFINKHEIFKNAAKDIKQSFIDKREEFVPSDSNVIKVADISVSKYYRLVIATGPKKCLCIDVNKKGDYKLKVTYDDMLNNIWQLQLDDGKFKIKNMQYPG